MNYAQVISWLAANLKSETADELEFSEPTVALVAVLFDRSRSRVAVDIINARFAEVSA